MTCAIVGWTGFVGQYLTEFYPEADLYNSSNIQHIVGKYYDIIYFSGMPAEKWKINLAPKDDARLVEQFCDVLLSVTCERFVLISTVDVLDCSIEQDETGNVYASHPYGHHRHQLEKFITERYPQHIILRLPGLFGKGLKKNILYDLLNNNQLENICLESSFQWYNLEHLKEDISFCIENDIKLVHLVSPSIPTKDIVSLCYPTKQHLCIGQRRVLYNLNTLYSRNRSILDEIQSFIEQQQQLQIISHRIAVSNLAWSPSNFRDVSKILGRYNIHRIEMAFTIVCDWGDWNDSTIEALRQSPFVYPSCQSILYKTNIHIFREPSAFLSHISHVLQLCAKLGITRIVFGSPTARHIYDSTEEERCILFRQIGSMCETNGIFFCIEPNSSHYGCTWLTTLDEVAQFVQRVNHPNIRINFDFGNYFMENDSTLLTPSILSLIKHTQVSAPYLKPLTKSMLAEYSTLWKILMDEGYSETISCELAPTSLAQLVVSLSHFIHLISSI